MIAAFAQEHNLLQETARDDAKISLFTILLTRSGCVKQYKKIQIT